MNYYTYFDNDALALSVNTKRTCDSSKHQTSATQNDDYMAHAQTIRLIVRSRHC